MVSEIAYATAEEVRTAMSGESSTDDVMIDDIVLAVSRMIDGYCGRSEDGFVALETAAERIYPGSGKRWMWIDEAIEIEEIKVKQSVTDPTFSKTLADTEWRGFRGDPRTSNTINFNKTPYHGVMLTASASVTRWLEGAYWDSAYYFYNDRDSYTEEAFEPTVEITAKWGYAEVLHPIIKQATIMQTERIYKRQRGGMADALISGEFGVSRFISKLDKDVETMLNKSRLIRPRLAGR